MTATDNGHRGPRLLTLTRSNQVTATTGQATVPAPATLAADETGVEHNSQVTRVSTASTADIRPSLPTKLPLLWHWLALLAIGGWLAFTARDHSGFVPAIVLLFLAGSTRTLIDLRTGRGALSARLGHTIANGMTLIAVAMAGMVATTPSTRRWLCCRSSSGPSPPTRQPARCRRPSLSARRCWRCSSPGPGSA